jgi:hypothetical protein
MADKTLQFSKHRVLTSRWSAWKLLILQRFYLPRFSLLLNQQVVYCIFICIKIFSCSLKIMSTGKKDYITEYQPLPYKQIMRANCRSICRISRLQGSVFYEVAKTFQKVLSLRITKVQSNHPSFIYLQY